MMEELSDSQRKDQYLSDLSLLDLCRRNGCLVQKWPQHRVMMSQRPALIWGLGLDRVWAVHVCAWRNMVSLLYLSTPVFSFNPNSTLTGAAHSSGSPKHKLRISKPHILAICSVPPMPVYSLPDSICMEQLARGSTCHFPSSWPEATQYTLPSLSLWNCFLLSEMFISVHP